MFIGASHTGIECSLAHRHRVVPKLCIDAHGIYGYMYVAMYSSYVHSPIKRVYGLPPKITVYPKLEVVIILKRRIMGTAAD